MFTLVMSFLSDTDQYSYNDAETHTIIMIKHDRNVETPVGFLVNECQK